MAKILPAIITQIADTGSGFAIAEDTDETIFIPSATVEKMELQEFDEIEAIVIENKKLHEKPDGTNWFAIRVRFLNEDEEDVA
jgi:hypothetical protein